MEAAMQRLEAQANAEAAAERQQTGKPRRGQTRKPVVESPEDKAQSHLSAPELPSMRTTNQGGAYGGNAQASVDAAYQIMVACDVPAAPNDKPQAAPMAQAPRAPRAQAGIALPQDEAGQAPALPATLDKGYDSEAAAQALED